MCLFLPPPPIRGWRSPHEGGPEIRVYVIDSELKSEGSPQNVGRRVRSFRHTLVTAGSDVSGLAPSLITICRVSSCAENLRHIIPRCLPCVSRRHEFTASYMTPDGGRHDHKPPYFILVMYPVPCNPLSAAAPGKRGTWVQSQTNPFHRTLAVRRIMYGDRGLVIQSHVMFFTPFTSRAAWFVESSH